MRHFLLWTLYAPLASFGDVAVGGTRPSFSYPTKSSIIGISDCAKTSIADDCSRRSRIGAAP